MTSRFTPQRSGAERRHFAARLRVREPSRSTSARRRRRVLADDSILPSLVVKTLAIQSAAILVSGVVEVATDRVDHPHLLGIGATLGVLAFLLRTWGREPLRARRTTVLPGLAVMWGLTVAIATVVFALSEPVVLLDGFTEAVAGMTTLAVTSVDPDRLGHGTILYRSLLQWLGGLLTINAVLVIMPTFGTTQGAREELGPGGTMALLGATSSRRSEVTNLVYLALTVLIGAGYAIAGMPGWHSVNHALTTASTGGFTVTSEGFAAYGAAIQWVAVLGMTLAGLGVMWLAVASRERRRVVQATEIRFFLVASVLVAAVIAIGSRGSGWSDGAREGMFSAMSAVSTTGFTTGAWETIEPVGQMLLIMLFGVGAAAGSAGGGFGARRISSMIQMAVRELRTAVHHRAVTVVRVDHHPVSEPVLDRIAAFAALYLLVVGVGAFGLALSGADMEGSISGAISAFSTMGPAFGLVTDAEHPEAVRLIQIALAVLGRTGLFALTVGLAHAAQSVSHATGRAAR